MPFNLSPAPRNADIAPFQVMEIAALARGLEVQGRSVIHMEIGEPDFPTPQPVLDAAASFLKQGGVYYTSALGVWALREAIAGHYKRCFNLEVSPERIIVTSGGSAALMLTFAYLVGRDDEILMSDPSYPCNRHFARLMEGRARTVPCTAESAYQFTAEQIATHWTAKARGVLVASPANPTGSMIPSAELSRIVDTVASRNGALVSDEVYQGLVYGRAPESVLSYTDQAFVIGSFSKYFNMTGWRLGWLVAPERCVRDLEKLSQNLYISPSSVAQHAALACFTDATYAIAESRRLEFQARRDFIIPALQSIGFKIPRVPEGGFFVYADCSAFGKPSPQFCVDVLNATGVAFAPGTDFGVERAEQHVRMAYAVSLDKLVDGVNSLKAYLHP